SAGETMGTISFMSPEQVRGDELDARTDIFSCGVVLYEMATGVLPFRAATSGLIFDGILNKQPPPASSLNPAMPAQLDRIRTKAREKDRAVRCRGARDLRTGLVRLGRDSGSAGPRPAEPAGVARAPADCRSYRRAGPRNGRDRRLFHLEGSGAGRVERAPI